MFFFASSFFMPENKEEIGMLTTAASWAVQKIASEVVLGFCP